MITHIVLFKFENVSHAKEAVEKLLSMNGRVPSLTGIEAGLDVSRSTRSYEVGLITRHNSLEDLEAYQIDPVHQQVAAFIRQHSSGAAAVDFTS